MNVISPLYMYADDTKLFRKVENELDHEILQQDLNALSEWSKDWLLNFHPEKCSVMHLGNSNPEFSYLLNERQLSKTTAEKDLGIIVADNLNFEQHIIENISKARQMWGLIRRNF